MLNLNTIYAYCFYCSLGLHGGMAISNDLRTGTALCTLLLAQRCSEIRLFWSGSCIPLCSSSQRCEGPADTVRQWNTESKHWMGASRWQRDSWAGKEMSVLEKACCLQADVRLQMFSGKLHPVVLPTVPRCSFVWVGLHLLHSSGSQSPRGKSQH